MRSLGRVPGLFFLALFFLCLVSSPASALPDQPGHIQNVLVLNSYHPTFVWTASQSDGIISALGKSGLNLSISVEYLDWKNYPDNKTLDNVTRLYRNKYGSRLFDVILTTDDAALNYVIGHRSDIFGNAPVVFSGANNYALLTPAQQVNITGKIEEISPEKTLSSVFMLFPSTNRIYILYEDTETGKGIADRIRNAESSYRDRAELIYITNITFDEMAATAHAFPAGSVIISAFTRDRAGTVMDHDRVMALLKANAPVPVFTMYDMAMGYGAIGGSILSGRHEGEIAGAMAVRILRGEPITAVPVNTGDTTIYQFDQDQLDRFSVPDSRLPAGSTVINRVPGLLDQYFFEVVAAVLAIIILIICVVVLTFNIRKRKQAEDELLRKNEKLHASYEQITATEEELRENFEELKKQEDVIRESDARLRSILHASPVMQFVIDQDHHVISWNKAIETYSGIRAEDIIGTDGQWRAFYKEKQPVLADIILDQTFDLLPVWFPEKFRKSRFVDDGYEVLNFFPYMGVSGKWLHGTAVPIRDARGAVTGAIETLEDITERKNAEDALRESEKFLTSVIENIPDMIFVKDARDLRFVRFNKAGEDLLGFSREELYGKNDYDFFPKDEADFFTKNDLEVLENRQLVDIPEEKIQTRHKGERVLHTKKIAIPDESGKPGYLLGISEDITERRRMENALQLARSKINLLNTVTFQDIQSAAFSHLAYNELLRRLVTDEKARAFLEKQQVLNQKIASSLDFAKNYQDMGVSPPRWQNIGQVFLIAISHLDFLHITRNLQVEGLEVYADPLLEKVFFHLMQNMIRHGEHATEVTLRYQKTPNGLVLFVEDNGVGIPAEEKHMIFDQGYGKNTGLGLFFVKEVLSITGMTIKETGEPGKGARFEITVPKESNRFAAEMSSA